MYLLRCSRLPYLFSVEPSALALVGALPTSHKGSDANQMGFWAKKWHFRAMVRGLSGVSAGYLCLQAAVGALSGQVKRIIVEASTGKLWTWAGHRKMVWRLGTPPSQLRNRQIIGRCPLRSAVICPMICRFPADFKRVAGIQRASPDASPTSGRYQPICPRLSVD